MRTRYLIGALMLVSSSLIAIQGHALEAAFARHPAPSPDGSTIVLSWQGDLWSVPAQGGQANRITVHPADERYPVYSRDGRWLAFSSNRHGNADIFIMPADASTAPRRLTFASVDDRPLDFTPDGSGVLFASRRAESIRRNPGLYTVSIDGGTPELLQPALALDAAYSPSGNALVFVRGGTRQFRRGYRGAASRDLWLDTGDEEHLRLTDFDGDDDAPSWLNDHELVFLSSRHGRKNLFRLHLPSGEVEPLTDYQTTAVRFPRASADGKLVAFEHGDSIWTIEPGKTGSAATRVAVQVPADSRRNKVEDQVARRGADDLVISPDGSLAAFVVKGDLYITAIASEEEQDIATPPTRRLTHTPAREQSPQWSPDGDRIVLTSSRTGNDDLFEIRPADAEAGWLDSFEYTVRQLTDSEAEERHPVFSPDGSRIIYQRGKGDLVLINGDGGSPRVILEHWQTPSWDWSPDGRWIAYSIPDVHYNSEVWIVRVDSEDTNGPPLEPYNVSRHPDDDLDPRWTDDGRRLVWLSKRFADGLDVWGVWLKREDHERTSLEWLQEWKNDKAGKSKPGGAESDEKPADNDEVEDDEVRQVAVEIDLDRLWERAERLTETAGDEYDPVSGPEGKTVLFTAEHEGERDLYSIRWDGKDLTRLTKGDTDPQATQLASDNETIFFLDSDGKIRRVDPEGKPGDPVPFEARVEIDQDKLRSEIFDEAWRALNEWFYDPEMHGVDWPAMRQTYKPLAMKASTDSDLADVMNLMLGELNASHMGYYPRPADDGDQTGWLGVTFDPAAGGPGLLITEVLPDSPAAAAKANLKEGERLIAVDGISIEPDRASSDRGSAGARNVYSLLNGTVDRRVHLRVRGSDGSERSTAVIPTTFVNLRRLRYEQWVRQRAAITERLSNGRIGYIHVQSMNMPSFEELEQGLYAAGHGKEGLIIDVRSNGGGWTTDYLMAVLTVRRHAYTVPRDEPTGVLAYPQSRLPLAAWTRPALAMCNEESYSNAEIFSWAFKTLERGLLVGSPTFGAVISTGATRLLDGARVRLPMRGWYVAGQDINMENNGVVPDLVVDQPPRLDTSPDTDLQLERAVEAFLEGLEQDPRYGAW